MATLKDNLKMARLFQLLSANGVDSKPFQELNGSYLERLKRLFQSGHLNFLIGSGASTPAIPTMGNLENELTELYQQGSADAKAEASAKELDFKLSLKPVTEALAGQTLPQNIQLVLASYTILLQHIEAILNNRSNSLLPKQANIFTTNYDLFLERASQTIASIILNDGFDRSSRLNSCFEYCAKNFFNSVYHNGTVYGYKVELPSINLLKLHGSCSWKVQDSKILFDVGNEDPTIILPRKQKFEETVINQTYYELLRLYANELDKENVLLLVFGFSFADEHILSITQRALKNPTLQIIVFCFSCESKTGYEEMFQAYSNVDIVFFDEELLTFDTLNKILGYVIPLRTLSLVEAI